MLVLNCALPVNSFADTSDYYDMDASSVIPLKTNSIVMEREIVRIKPILNKIPATWHVSAEFIFHNKSDKEEAVTMGYPDWINWQYDPRQNKEFWAFFKTLPLKVQETDNLPFDGWVKDVYFEGYEKGKLPYIKDAWNLHDLTVKINGGTITNFLHKAIDLKTIKKDFLLSTLERGNTPEGAFVWKTKFGPQETKTVDITFGFTGLVDMGYQKSVYLLTTGALWADKIGVGDIYWEIGHLDDAPNVNFKATGPGGYKLEDGGKVLHWHFENLKPKEDIVLISGTAQNNSDDDIPTLITTFCSKKYDGNTRDYDLNDLNYRTSSYKEFDTPGLYVKALINEIYARHGREFHSEDLREIFGSCDWYKPTFNYSDKLLNSYEWKNIKFLLDYEKQKGWRQ